MHHSEEIGARGIIRDHSGKLIYAFFKNPYRSSSNLRKAFVAKLGMQWCISQDFQNIILDCDSFVIIINVPTNNISITCPLQGSIEDMKQMFCQTNDMIQHCYREGLGALAKWS